MLRFFEDREPRQIGVREHHWAVLFRNPAALAVKDRSDDRTRHRVADAVVQQLAVGQAGQRVAQRLLGQLGRGGLQRALPLGTRKDFSEFLEVTPGVTARTFDQGTGGQVYMLRGSEIENHVVQVDGADMGSFRQGWAGLYVGLSTDSIEDTQVKTGGVDASAPLGVGVIINIATPSGTNRFKGAASTIYQSKSWNGNNAAPGGQSVYNRVFQPDV